jgi:hypothetical protein
MPGTKIEPACSNCEYLRKCSMTTERLLRMGFSCSQHKLTSDAELDAREDLIDDFGLWALRYEVPSVKNVSPPKIKPRRRKKNV